MAVAPVGKNGYLPLFHRPRHGAAKQDEVQKGEQTMTNMEQQFSEGWARYKQLKVEVPILVTTIE